VKPGTARDITAMKKKRETKRLKRLMKDEENYIGYQAKDHHTEEGYAQLKRTESGLLCHILAYLLK